MAVSAPVEKLPKSEPDIGKLNNFNPCIVTVVKYMQQRGTIGTTLVPTVQLPLQQVLDLVTTLPLKHGPGFYKFTVADGGGTGEDVWMTRLGGDMPMTQDGGFPMAVNPPDQQSNNTPPSAGVRHLGRGFYYDPEMGVLTTPWGSGINWRPGDAFPTPPTSAQPAHLASVPPNATPWSWQGPQQQQGGWGGWPVDSGESATVKRLEAELAETRRRTEMDGIRSEMRRQADETQKQFAALIDKLAARPSGPSEGELRLQAEMAETRRRAEETERRAEQDRKDAAQREEARRADDQRRADMLAMKADFDRTIAALSTSKTDPMLPMLMQLITAQQASAMEAVKAIQSATATGTAAAERSQQQMLAQLQGSIMSPIQLMQLLQSAKGDAAEGTKAVVEATKEAMALQKDVFTQLLEVSGQGGQPWYAGAIQGALDRAAQITAALAERSQAQAQVVQQQQVQQMQPQQMRRQVTPRANPIQPQVAPLQGAPTAISAPVSDARPEGAAYDKTTDEIVLVDGRRFWQPYVGQNGWRRVLSLPASTVEREIAELRAASASSAQGAAPAVAPMNGVQTSGNIAPAAVTGDLLQMPAPKKRPGRKPKPGTEQTHEQILAMINAMTDADPHKVFEAISKIEDRELFGDLLFPYVEQLRAIPPVPAEVAKYVLQARGQVQGFGGTVPVAIALLNANQIQVLVERLVPDQPPEYQDACVSEIGAALEAENLGDDEDEDDEATE